MSLSQQLKVNTDSAANHHLECLVVGGVDGVPLDGRFLFTLAGFVRQKVTFDITGEEGEKMADSVAHKETSADVQFPATAKSSRQDRLGVAV